MSSLRSWSKTSTRDETAKVELPRVVEFMVLSCVKSASDDHMIMNLMSVVNTCQFHLGFY